MGEEEVLEESGVSAGGPGVPARPGGGSRAGGAESADRQPASLGGVSTGGTAASAGDCGKERDEMLLAAD